MTTAAITREYFTPPEAATMLGIDVHRVLEFIRAGELAASNLATRLGGKRPRYRISRAALESFLTRRSVGPPPAPVRRVRRLRGRATDRRGGGAMNHSGNGHTATLERPSCLDDAIRYRCEMGLPITICREKHPGAVVGKGWQHRRFTEAEIEQYWDREPNLNVGTILGPESGLVNFDCDSEQAETDYARLFEGCEIPTPPPTHISRRGRNR